VPSRTLSKRKAFKGGMHMSHRDFSFKNRREENKRDSDSKPRKSV